MKCLPTELEGAYVLLPQPFTDERGWFARVYCRDEFAQVGIAQEWVQINHSFNRQQATVRGMHFQYPPHAEAKLVRCIRGRVYDVIVDLRRGSPTMLAYFGVELSAENQKMLYIPEGFAHGFQTLTDNVELLYHHSAFYAPDHEGGLHFDDPAIGIDWPLVPGNVSVKDRERPFLTEGFAGI